jgi:hypothetical protein
LDGKFLSWSDVESLGNINENLAQFVTDKVSKLDQGNIHKSHLKLMVTSLVHNRGSRRLDSEERNFGDYENKSFSSVRLLFFPLWQKLFPSPHRNRFKDFLRRIHVSCRRRNEDEEAKKLRK